MVETYYLVWNQLFVLPSFLSIRSFGQKIISYTSIPSKIFFIKFGFISSRKCLCKLNHLLLRSNHGRKVYRLEINSEIKTLEISMWRFSELWQRYCFSRMKKNKVLILRLLKCIYGVVLYLYFFGGLFFTKKNSGSLDFSLGKGLWGLWRSKCMTSFLSLRLSTSFSASALFSSLHHSPQTPSS